MSKQLLDELEQCRVQLAGCLTAAEGGTSEPVVAKQGDYGWSLAYQKVLDLRRKYDYACERLRHDVDRLALEHYRRLDAAGGVSHD